jgi:hypothetical protein
MSQFDPSAFLDATVTEASTKRPPLPAGMDFVGVIGAVTSKTWVGKKDPTQSGIIINVPIEFDLTAYPDVQKQLGLDKITLTDSIMLDTTEDGAINLAPGKNAKLRRYREALDMNTAGQPFSFRAMTGRLIKAKIKHDPYEGEIYDKIDSVARAS